ncbi:hypothetical protein [Microcoleus sp. MON2_D5]|uniref:hypothetical protein n=1 Tax=Microcoleus sp. MON2_D5 TaxID=2818833 RepID=UPI002FD4C411
MPIRGKVSVNFNGIALQGAALRAFERTMKDLGNTFQEVISEVGAFPDFPQSDIIDTGALKESQTVAFPSPGSVVFDWPVEYAPYVHDGYTLQNGAQQPGRPWTSLGLQKFDPVVQYTANLNAELAFVPIAMRRVGLVARRKLTTRLSNWQV